MFLNHLTSYSQGGSYALEFDGSNDYVTLPNSINMGTSDFTISIRFKTDVIGSGRQQVFQQTGENANRVIAINNNGVIASQLGATSSESGFTASANTWYHVVLVHDDSENTLKWYVDGTAKNTNTSVNIGSNTGIFKLGTNSGSSDKWFDELEELGFNNPSEENIPKEFLSDKWYLKDNKYENTNRLP